MMKDPDHNKLPGGAIMMGISANPALRAHNPALEKGFL
jgi:hypothetical protein